MSPLEIWATVFTVASVLLTNFRSKTLYPVGIVGTILFFFVFWNAKLYASAGLQVYFTLIQLYGWWFWSKGNNGAEPPIGNWSWKTVGLLLIPASALTVVVSTVLNIFTDAHSAFLDTAIFALSVLAQFLLDRKQQKNWAVWGAVNVLSIYVYASQHLWITTALYVGLLLNVFVGWTMWKRAQAATQPVIIGAA